MPDLKNMLTNDEQNAIAAVQNESGDVKAAYDNAHVYADQYGVPVGYFRAVLESLFGEQR